MFNTPASSAMLPVLCAVLSSACVADSNLESSDSDAKKEALLGGKTDHIDRCAANHWYGDGECDTFCPKPDPDCESVGSSDACELHGWYDDGLCDTFCPEPDPDCDGPLAAFDPRSCSGPGMTFDQALSRFGPGTVAAGLGSDKVWIRKRTCNSVTGCSDFGEPQIAQFRANVELRVFGPNIWVTVDGNACRRVQEEGQSCIVQSPFRNWTITLTDHCFQAIDGPVTSLATSQRALLVRF